MKVFYLDDIPTPYRLGVFKKIAERCDGEFRVGFCADAEPGRTWDLSFEGINFEIIDGFQWRPPFQLNPFSIKINLKIINVLHSFKPDVVVMSGYTHPTIFLAVAYCRIKKIPFGIVSETNEHCSVTSGPRWWIKKRIIYPIVHFMSIGLPTGSQAENYFRKLGCKNISYFHFPNTPDIFPIKEVCISSQSIYEKKSIRKKYNLDEEMVIILFVGRLILAKNPIELVAAFKKLSSSKNPSAMLVIVGSGEQDKPIQESSKNNPYIKKIPWLNKPKDVYELMAIADIFVLPSIHEPWGAVVNEALAAGCCVVTSNKVGSSYDLIEHGVSGYIYESGNINQLAKILSILVESESIREKVSIEGQKSALFHAQDYAVDNFLSAVTFIEDNAGN